MYTIGQVAEMFGLPVSTLRYYDKQGLFPELERTSGIRRFGDTELEALRVIECLKKAGMEIKDIRLFMEWCAEGPSTYPKRKAMFEERKAHMESEIANMNRALDMLKFKCWYYEQAIQDGNELFPQCTIIPVPPRTLLYRPVGTGGNNWVVFPGRDAKRKPSNQRVRGLLFPLDGAKDARYQAQMTFHTQAPVAIVGYFTMVKQSGNSCSSPYFAPRGDASATKRSPCNKHRSLQASP